jgi:predicted nuclease of predicted toxin-antitoxin system
MGGEPGSQPDGESRLVRPRSLLFDENVTPIGRALQHVYREAVIVSVDTPDLGMGAKDEVIIPWCAANNAVWITKDWRRKRNREQARELYEKSVSVAWFRPSSGREWTIEVLLYVAAKAMPRLIRFYGDPGVRYALIDENGSVNELSLERLLRGNL